jgi:hypothetical protein
MAFREQLSSKVVVDLPSRDKFNVNEGLFDGQAKREAWARLR